MSSSNIFSDLTNLYSLSKTLKFELKPVGNTQKMLEDAKIFEKDKAIQRKYEITKSYFDRLHREFVREALQGVKLSELEVYLEIFKKWKIDKKENDEKLKNEERKLRKEVVKFFDKQGELWAKKYKGLKNKDIEILFEEAVFESILKERYQNDPIQKDGEIIPVEILDESTGKLVSVFSSWKGFTGYFDKFFETRKNFYKDNGTAYALATRIINDSLKRFCANILIFESLRDKVDFTEVEHNFEKALSEIFSLDFYNSCLLQDGIDFYNKIIGGETLPNGEKKKGLNECINLHRQQKNEKLPFFIALDNQILGEKEKFLIDEIKDDEEFFNVLKEFSHQAEKRIIILRKLFIDFVEHQENYNLEEIYFSKEAFNTISRKWTSETDGFEDSLYKVLKEANIVTSSAEKAKQKEGGYSFPDFFALCHIKNALEAIEVEAVKAMKINDSQTVVALKFWKERYYEVLKFEERTLWEQFLAILNYEFSSLFEREINNKKIGYSVFQEDLKRLIEDLKIDSKAKVAIKDYADSVLTIYQMAKYFSVEKKRRWNTEYKLDVFYTDPINGYLQFYKNAYEEIVQVYNKLRNYLTKKTYDLEKWKLNFEKANLAKGWPDSPEGNTQYCSFIFRNKRDYFLGITDFPTLFDKLKFPEAYKDDGEDFEKMVYKQIDGKTLYGSVYKGLFGNKYSEDREKLNDIELLQRMKQVLETRVQFFPEFSKFIKKIEDNEYETAKELALEIKKGSFYRIFFESISAEYLYRGIYKIFKNTKCDFKIKKLYLFQINNKDWNKGSTGTKNLHTLYFESLFSTENSSLNFPIKLDGQAEIFYRPKTDVQKLGTKKDKKGKEVVNHKRYKDDKIFFHVKITLNRTKDEARYFKLNPNLNLFLAKNSNVNIIGVDRGEKNLAYFSVINQKGEILDSGSLNLVGKDEKGKAIDYHQKLEVKAEKRLQERKDWQAVEGIKDLKKGYISQVVHKLAELAIQYNAIIVFEDLNMRFKQIRGGIEKSVYQQLEKALIDKLSYLINKEEKDPEQAGHLFNAYQLSAPFTSFKDMGKQTGIIFYTKASYTSKIDPLTGWRPNLYLRYSNAEKAKRDILKFSRIDFVNGMFEFEYDIKKFQELKEYPKNTVWTVCSNVERFKWNKSLNNNIGGYTHYFNLTDGKVENINLKSSKPANLKELFEKYGININDDIKAQIEKLETKGNEKFFEHLIFFFNLICQIRNTDDSEQAKHECKDDFILSPVKPFFDSRNPEKFGKELPKNGDDNGAYNIARKGIIILQKITDHANKQGNCNKLSWKDLNINISDTEWDNFAQKSNKVG